jgi:hypothetical protein
MGCDLADSSRLIFQVGTASESGDILVVWRAEQHGDHVLFAKIESWNECKVKVLKSRIGEGIGWQIHWCLTGKPV